ncbi:TonB-dependent siderophore receptor [Caulobacter radicis]|uniref:TonB-dependent siderophore receptor n=1 Tax=Caulobacter radicis TaxID=2172650 RepID=UPI0014031970|nr:TonB-dependent receptor [Caulobacter radicis]
MKKSVSIRSYLATTALCGALVFAASAASAQQRNYAIPAGDLKTALTAYEAASGRHVRVDGDLAGATTQGVQGALSPRQALDRLLEGSSAMACADGAVIVSRTAGCPAKESTVSEVVVTSTAVSHLSDRNRTGTRIDADPMTVPLSVSTISEALIERQQAITLADAAANVVGVNSGIEGSFSMRGFSANIMRNGTLGADGRSNNLPIVAISRVEVVKGPEAIIAGVNAGYGGVVNVITKTPPNRPTGQVTASVGSRGYYDVGMDIGGPLNADNTIRARLVASTQNSDHNAAGYVGSGSNYIAPSVTFKVPRLGTEVTAQYEYQKLRTAPELLVIGRPGDTKLSGDLPIVAYGPKNGHRDIEAKTTTIAVEQPINADWNFAIRYTKDLQHRNNTVPTPFALYALVPYPEALVLGVYGTTDATVESLKYELKGKFATGPISHSLLLAYDDIQNEALISQRPAALYSTNMQTGVTRDRTADLGPIFGFPGTGVSGGARPKESGVLLMDQLTWGKLVVLAGVRRMKYDFAQLNAPPVEPFEKTLPSLGVVYRLTPELSLYGNASKGFKPNQGQFVVGGGAVAPEEAQQFELGAKALLLNKRIAATAALFQIEQKNVANPDPDNPWPLVICQGASQVCYVSIPGVTSKGVEFEVSGQVLPRLELRTTYTYTDKKVDPRYQANTPYAHHQFTLWATYNFGNDGLGWWAGGGVQARSKQIGRSAVGDLANPGQARIDLSLGYDAMKWSALLGVKNVADKRLYDINSGPAGQGNVLQPREVMATLRYRFR